MPRKLQALQCGVPLFTILPVHSRRCAGERSEKKREEKKEKKSKKQKAGRVLRLIDQKRKGGINDPRSQWCIGKIGHFDRSGHLVHAIMPRDGDVFDCLNNGYLCVSLFVSILSYSQHVSLSTTPDRTSGIQEIKAGVVSISSSISLISSRAASTAGGINT
jgi:hypothetical protein